MLQRGVEEGWRGRDRRKRRERKEGERMRVVDAMWMCVGIVLMCKTRGRMLKIDVTRGCVWQRRTIESRLDQ